MSHINPDRMALVAMLTHAKTIAIVGASSDEHRPSHGVMKRLLGAGYHCVPVNPNERAVLGQPAVAALTDITIPVDIVDVFRRTDATPEVAQQAVAIGATALWLQSGIWNDEAATIAKQGGLSVVMDLCIAVEYELLGVTR